MRRTIALYSSLALLLCLCFIYHIEGLNSSFSVELIHRDSSRSPFYRPTETQFERVANAVSRSIKRASIPTNTPQTTITPDRGEYIMSYSVGTPPFHLFGIVDTGSDMVWLQCKPCQNCYHQTTPMFDPLKSQTYKNIPCSSATCRSLPDGDLSVETLTLSSTNGYPFTFPRIVIGCGHNNNLPIQGINSGAVGLGKGPFSLISQMGSSIGGKFSYCLVPMLSKSKVSSKLNFGDKAVVYGYGTVFTPIVQKNPNIFYHLTLEAFSVGEHKIEFGYSEVGNIVIDSGTTLTLLPNNVYSKLELAVANVVRLKRVEDPTRQLSLCYRTTSEQLKVPIITAHFRGANVQLNALNTFVPVADGVSCFAFASTQGDAIFGNLAQQNFLVGYDLQKSIVLFKPTDCTKQY
ncbi:aspartic proteinase CDR1-like [Gastrolobium bilobum]|uniref:aspartic proteinase CDR1-like n=1 Tax=Gastrolobium bilobum TaxID=150636 RepID=UPI002AB119ED|nr:aspartic proteinase CDR1-like [Gastrolobium bilobum]